MRQQLTKLECAVLLLEAGLEAHLDRADYVSAIVLAGASEDVFEGLVTERRKSRHKLRARDILLQLTAWYHGRGTLTRRQMEEERKATRTIYNWLRHNDQRDEAQVIVAHLHDEAVTVLQRALFNYSTYTGAAHRRALEVVLWGPHDVS